MSDPDGRRVHFRTCSLCEAMCGLRIELEAGRIASIRGDELDPLSRGHVCPKGVALKELQQDPDRLRAPMRRSASGWETVSWDAALDEAARGLHEIQRAHGRDAVASYLGNPTVHDHGALLFVPLLLRTLRSRSRFSATSVDQLPQALAAYFLFGHPLLVPIPDLDRTRYLLMLGANPLASNGSLMTAPDVRARLRAIQQRGGKVVVVDPRRTETARAADEHLFIRPGTDALLLLAILRELLEGGPRLGRLAPFTNGLGALREAAGEFTPERAARHTGISPEAIRRLAQEFHAAEAAVAYGRVGTSTQAFGAVCHWIITAVNAVTGNLDREGGAMFTSPAFDPVAGRKPLAASRGGFARWRTRVRGLPEFAGELPVAALAEEILTPGDGRIRALLTHAGNPVLSTPNGRQLDRALASLDFMVSIDPYLNETTRHARVILPPTTALERSHFDIAFHTLAVRNTAKYSPPLFPPPRGALHDWQILLALRRRLERLGRGRSLKAFAAHEALRRLGPDGLLDLGLRLGPHGRGLDPLRRGLSVAALRRAPHGVDLGPLRPVLPARLRTSAHRIELAPPPLVRDLDRLRETFPAAGTEHGGVLSLIGRRHLRDNNSWMHNAPLLMTGRSRCTLMMHPEDARARGLGDGALVTVTSRVGRVTVPVEVTEDVMRGVVSLPHGYGHDRPGVRLSLAVRHPGVSVNDLTDEREIDLLSGNAAFSGVEVVVERAA